MFTEKKRKNIAVILSGGSGNRFGSAIPKQFIMLGGKKVIEYTIDTFDTHNDIDEICLVINPDYEYLIEEMVSDNDYKKIKKIIYGGKERFESSFSAIQAYQDESYCNLIFHDAVRPFVSEAIISRVVEALEDNNAIDVAIPATDTIIQIDKKQCISNIPERRYIQQGQTPQAFVYETIAQAYSQAEQEGFKKSFTDDCGLILYYLPNEPVKVVMGSLKNIKITQPEDLLLAEKLLQIQSLNTSKKHQLSFNQLKSRVIVVFGGSSGIGKDIVTICKNNEAHVISLSRKDGVNINDSQAIAKSLEEIYQLYGRIDFVINTAGILKREKLSSMSEADIDDIINTNLKAAIMICQHAFNYLKKSQGHLILFTSSSYTRGRDGYSIYSATKAAIVNFMQAVAQEWAGHNIRINAINPARTKTPMRVSNFGIEPEETLLSSDFVAMTTLEILFESFSGQVIDIKKN